MLRHNLKFLGYIEHAKRNVANGEQRLKEMDVETTSAEDLRRMWKNHAMSIETLTFSQQNYEKRAYSPDLIIVLRYGSGLLFAVGFILLVVGWCIPGEISVGINKDSTKTIGDILGIICGLTIVIVVSSVIIYGISRMYVSLTSRMYWDWGVDQYISLTVLILVLISIGLKLLGLGEVRKQQSLESQINEFNETDQMTKQRLHKTQKLRFQEQSDNETTSTTT